MNLFPYLRPPLPSLLRGHAHMMYALGGEGGTPKADESTDKLRECDSDNMVARWLLPDFQIVCVWPFGLLDYGSATLHCKI